MEAIGVIPYLLASLAVWRVALLFVEDAGPFQIFQRARTLAGVIRYPDGTVQAPATFIAGVLSCVRCASLWLSVIAMTLVWPDDWRTWVLGVFGLAGAAALIEVMRRR